MGALVIGWHWVKRGFLGLQTGFFLKSLSLHECKNTLLPKNGCLTFADIRDPEHFHQGPGCD